MRVLRPDGKIHLTDVDKKILKTILIPNGVLSHKELAEKLNIPSTTLQRRRHRLNSILSMNFSLDLYKYGWRRVDLLIATQNGLNTDVATRLHEQEDITFVQKTIGQHTIDLKAEVIVKDNGELLGVLERIRAMRGVKEVMWSEVVETMNQKISVPIRVIDML